jgi:glutamate-ammonia-ligase adenylyltransferase
MLVVSFEAFGDYQRKEAWTWEHMALARARPVFGSKQARARASALIDEILRQPYDPKRLAADASKMREEMSRHKPASGPLDTKLGPGGLVDLEFAVHVLQLAHKKGLVPNMEKALKMLAKAGLVQANIIGAQHLLTEMLVTIRLLAPQTTTPSEESCELMARACGAEKWSELLARHDEARQSISALWEKVKESA